MFNTIRTAVSRLFGGRNDESTTEAPEQSAPAETTEPTPIPDQPSHPDYRSLNAAVEAARNNRFMEAHLQLAEAREALKHFTFTRSLYLAGAALVNAEDGNAGIAGRLIEQAMVQFGQDARKLSQDEQHFVMTALRHTLRKVPIEKLRNGHAISNDRQTARKLCQEGRFGEAINLLRRAARAVHASTCLRNHPAAPYATLFNEIDNVYDNAAFCAQEEAHRLCGNGQYGLALRHLEAAARFVAGNTRPHDALTREIDKVLTRIEDLTNTRTKMDQIHIARTGVPVPRREMEAAAA